MEEYYEEYWKRKARKDYQGCMVSLCGAVMIVLALLCMLMLSSCSTPKITEQEQHHHSQVDTMAVQAAVDARMQTVREQLEQYVHTIVSSQTTEQQSQEQEKERITETITTWVDSLGRAFRQEQRTTDRDISRQQQLREERMRQEYEERMQQTVDSLDAAWEDKFKLMKGRWEEQDSTSMAVKPVPGDNRPWYKRWWDNLRWMILGAVALAIGWIAAKIIMKFKINR